MPVFNFTCCKCSQPQRRLLDKISPSGYICSTVNCRGPLRRVAQAPSTQTLERLDNGCMPRALERLEYAQEIYDEHAAADPIRKRDNANQ
jgi:hypothetical protein